MTTSLRCSECGHPCQTRRGPTGETEALACPHHPDAVVLEWSGTYQSAAIWIEQFSDGRTSDEVGRAIGELPEGGQKATLLATWQLWQTWGGLPERRVPAFGSVASLYGSGKRGPSP